MSGGPLWMLDTNMAAYVVSGRSQAARRTLRDSREHGTVAFSAVSQGEILFGLAKRPEAIRLRAAVEELFGVLQIMAWDSIAADAYGTLRARLEGAGKSLCAMDMMIAAHAVATEATLVTHDRAFKQAALPLDVVDWADDL